MIAIIDYGAGNIFSVKNALEHLGIDAKLTSDKSEIANADGMILPGVGAFGFAMEKLQESGLADIIKEQSTKKPLLGICLGMQLLFDKSYEFGEHEGLGLIHGYVDKIVAHDLVVPHMGWNKLEKQNVCPMLENVGNDSYVYFVHSYKAFCDDNSIAAYCEYGGKVPALVYDGKYVYGAQFHPEKSGDTGLSMLKSFAKICKEV